MTKLQEELHKAITIGFKHTKLTSDGQLEQSMSTLLAESAAEVVKEYIEVYKQSLENKMIKHQDRFLEEIDGEYFVIEGYMTQYSEWDDMRDLLDVHHDEWLKESGTI